MTTRVAGGSTTVLAALLVVSGCATNAPTPTLSTPTLSTPTPSSGPVAPVESASPGAELVGPQPIPASATVAPTRVVIPAIGVDQTNLEQLTRNPGTGELNAPVDFDRAGYYVDGATPGDPGPAVIAGHVDDTRGPKVFYRLRELKTGDPVTVTRSDGAVVTFRVDAVEQYPKGAFPTDAVYGPAPGSSLRLITCGGVYDAAARSYRDNIVVYASQVPPPSP